MPATGQKGADCSSTAARVSTIGSIAAIGEPKASAATIRPTHRREQHRQRPTQVRPPRPRRCRPSAMERRGASRRRSRRCRGRPGQIASMPTTGGRGRGRSSRSSPRPRAAIVWLPVDGALADHPVAIDDLASCGRRRRTRRCRGNSRNRTSRHCWAPRRPRPSGTNSESTQATGKMKPCHRPSRKPGARRRDRGRALPARRPRARERQQRGERATDGKARARRIRLRSGRVRRR